MRQASERSPLAAAASRLPKHCLHALSGPPVAKRPPPGTRSGGLPPKATGKACRRRRTASEGPGRRGGPGAVRSCKDGGCVTHVIARVIPVGLDAPRSPKSASATAGMLPASDPSARTIVSRAPRLLVADEAAPFRGEPDVRERLSPLKGSVYGTRRALRCAAAIITGGWTERRTDQRQAPRLRRETQ